MEYTDLTDGNSLSDKMKINIHMFGALMLNGVGGEVHGADVIAVDESATRRRTLELMEQLTQPSGLSHAVGDGAVLDFRAEPRDDRMSLSQPGHKVVPEEHRAARRRAMSGRVNVRYCKAPVMLRNWEASWTGGLEFAASFG
jgi:hypothetical protein